MIWHVHRREDGSIASAHQEMQPGYAEEKVDDAKDAELQAMLAPQSPARDPLAEIDALKQALFSKSVIAEADVAAAEVSLTAERP